MLDLLVQLVTVLAPLSLVAIGGGNSVLPDIHRQVVTVHGWMTDTEFADAFQTTRSTRLSRVNSFLITRRGPAAFETLRRRLDRETCRRLASTITLPHRVISGLKVPAEAISVKERAIFPALREFSSDHRQRVRVARQSKRQGFIILQGMCHEFGKSHGMQKAPSHARRKSFATDGN